MARTPQFPGQTLATGIATIDNDICPVKATTPAVGLGVVVACEVVLTSGGLTTSGSRSTESACQE
jgi:hypothetical protein